ncbi:hypothetical protein [Acidithiobacillus sp.]|uniref:hypothetical protein n=1 Tax=Acidithiobacillus sp. TaxID=1872118 RepID=UPI00262C2F13|nr:hypothetical protein [Acidithiobacillus sp.]MDD2749607.1 hypothetical protein [Acidithiobacillus sp.]MDD5280526.1 hypothetical protein [Acidithiobacillus sp.]
MAIQIPDDLLPRWFTVKALAKRWDVDQDFIAAMMTYGQLETWVAADKAYKQPRCFDPGAQFDPGIYRVATYNTGLLNAQWVYGEAHMASPRHAGEFPLPVTKKSLNGEVFSLLTALEGWETEPEHCTNIVARVEGFLVPTTAVLEMEQAATPEEIREGVAPRAVESRRILLTVIDALASKAGINTRNRSATTEILTALQLAGTPASERTIRDAVKDIPEAVRNRRVED